MSRWAAVIGSPVAHSLSPALHREAFRQLGLDWEYTRIEVRPPELPGFIHHLDTECVGLSVTAPLKKDLLDLVGAVDGMAGLTGAGNTLARQMGIDAAFNTDVQGIVDAVSSRLRPLAARRRTLPVLNEEPPGLLSGLPAPVILGTGATACSALAAVKTLGGSSAYLVGRTFAGPENALAVAARIGIDVRPLLWRACERYQSELDATPLLISTVPPAVTSDFATAMTPNPDAVLLDVTYAQGRTPLERRFENGGATVVSPLEMLTHQGIAQVKIWTSRDVPFDPVFSAVKSAASRRTACAEAPVTDS